MLLEFECASVTAAALQSPVNSVGRCSRGGPQEQMDREVRCGWGAQLSLEPNSLELLADQVHHMDIDDGPSASDEPGWQGQFSWVCVQGASTSIAARTRPAAAFYCSATTSRGPLLSRSPEGQHIV